MKAECPNMEHCEALWSAKRDKKKEEISTQEYYEQCRVDAMPEERGGILVIGLYPGNQEVKQNENAVGPSGKLLRRIFHFCYHRFIKDPNIKFKKEDVPYMFFTNIIQCKCRRQNTEKENQAAAVKCSIHIKQIIQEMQPEMIVTCGELPAKFFMGKKFKTLIKQRAYFGEIAARFNGIPIYSTWNAARCVNNEEKIAGAINARSQIKNDIMEIINAWIKQSKRTTEKRVLPVGNIL